MRIPYLQCIRCERVFVPTLGEVNAYLRTGWPTCCELTMKLESANTERELAGSSQQDSQDRADGGYRAGGVRGERRQKRRE